MKVSSSTSIYIIARTLIASFLILAGLPPLAQVEASAVTSVILIQNHQAQNQTQAADPPFVQAEQLRAVGSRESLDKALEKYQEALRFRRAARDRAGEAIVLNRIGLTYLGLNDEEKALGFLAQGLPILREVGDISGEAENLTNTGGAYYLMGKKERAIDCFQQAATLSQTLDDKRALAKILKSIAAVCYELSVPHNIKYLQKALIYAAQARQLSRFLEDTQGETESLYIIGNVLERYRITIKQSRIRNDSMLPLQISKLCYWYSLSDEKYKAVECYKALLREGPSETPVREALGQEYMWLGDYQNALENYNKALKGFRGRSDKARQLTNIGYTYYLLGDSQKALYYYNQALPLSQAGNNQYDDLYTEALTLTALGLMYSSSDDYEIAINYYMKALPKVQSYERKKSRLEGYVRSLVLFDTPLEGIVITAIGIAYSGLGEKRKALDHMNQGLNLIRSAGDRIFESIALANIGLTYYELGDKQKALNYYRQARLVSQIAADRRGEASALYGMAFIKRELGDLIEARNLIESAIKSVEDIRARTPGQELRSSYFSSVRKYYELYIDVLMQLHKQHPSDGFDTLAFHASERARARSLLDLLSETQIDFRQGVDKDLLKRERELQQQLSAKAEAELRLLTEPDNKQDATELSKEIETLTSAYQDVQTQIRVKNRRYAALTLPQPLTLKEIQQKVLDTDTMLLEYALGEERSFLWAVSATTITSYELPGRTQIETAAKRFYQLLTEPNRIYQESNRDRGPRVTKVDAQNKQITDVALTLSKILLEPVAPELWKKRLVIVTEGALQYVPFAALPEPQIMKSQQDYKQPLLVNHEIVNLPSLSAIDAIRKEASQRKPAPKTIAVIADPVFDKDDERVKVKQSPKSKQQIAISSEERDLIMKAQTSAKESGINDTKLIIPRLPGTREEAEKILALVPYEEQLQALDFVANRKIATSPDLGNYRIIHFATHGLANSIRPELSGILLSMVDEQGIQQNGFLQAHEVYNLRFSAELIVLSACQTALGKDVKGEGLVGLSRGFMYAGASRVMASLWRVDDEATAQFMARFYRGILKEGLNPVAALRTAQIAMLKEQRWDAPYYWAAFTLQGEWR